MKRFFICILLTIAGSTLCSAQDFLVYGVKGDISVNNGGKQQKVVAGMILKGSSIITIPSEARLIVLDEKEKQLYTLKNPTTDILETLLKKDVSTTQQLTDSYLTFIKSKLTNSANPKDKNYKQTAGNSYRETDSLLIKVLVPPEEKKDSLNKVH